MYLGRQQPFTSSMLQLTGQLHIQVQPPLPLSHGLPYYPHLHSQHQNQKGFYVGLDGGNEAAERYRKEVEVLKKQQQQFYKHGEWKMHQQEEAMKRNMQMMNEQTLQAFQSERAHLNNTIKTQALIKLSQQMAQMQEQLLENSGKQQEEHSEQVKKARQMENRMEQRINKLMKEKAQMEQKLDEVTEQVEQLRAEVQKNKRQQEEEKEERIEMYEEGRVEEVERRIKQLEEKINSRQQEIEEVACYKVGNFEELASVMEDEKNGGGYLFDQTTPYAHYFEIGEKIKKKEDEGYWDQLLLTTVIGKEDPFIFHVGVKSTKKGALAVGVVDRCSQRENKFSYDSKNAITYNGYNGYLYYGHDGANSKVEKGVKIVGGMNIRVEVRLGNKTIHFTLTKDGESQQFVQASDILGQFNRQFVPFLEMGTVGDEVICYIL